MNEKKQDEIIKKYYALLSEQDKKTFTRDMCILMNTSYQEGFKDGFNSYKLPTIVHDMGQ